MFHDHHDSKPATSKQRQTLYELGIDVGDYLTSQQANELIRENQAAWRQLPATESQVWYLRKYGKWYPGMTRGKAADLISQAKAREEAQPRPRPAILRPYPPPGRENAGHPCDGGNWP